jgi:hypothetical protein
MENQAEATPDIAKAPGEAVTFEDMEAAMAQDIRDPQVENQSTGVEDDGQEPAQEEHKVGAGQDDKQAEPDDSEEAVEEPKESEEAEEVEARAEGSDKVVEKEKDGKIYKVSSGDSELDVPASGEVEVVVKGETMKVPLQDLINDYSGGTNWNKKFSELNDQRKEFESNRQLLHDTVDTMYSQLVEQKDWRAMITTVAESFGANPFEIIREVRSQVLDPDANDLSEDDLRAKESAEEAEYWKNRLERDKQKAEKSQRAETARKRLDEIAEEYGMTDEDIVTAYDSLLESGKSKQEIEDDISLLGKEHSKGLRAGQISTILKEVSPDLTGEALAETEQLLVSELSDAEFTEDDLREIIVEVYGSKSQKAILKKVKKGQEVVPETKEKPKNAASDPLFFDDLPEDE